MYLLLVFRSWMNPRAKEYRRIYDIPDHIGTAVNVQMMVFGNTGARSGTGVGFTRNPATGETVGDTSQFEAQADWLKGSVPLEVSVASIEIKGRRFEGLSGKVGASAK